MASSSSPEPDWCFPRGVLDPEHVLEEHDIHPLAEPIGVKWRDLGRAFGYEQHRLDAWQMDKQNSTKECCIEVLVSWIRREGQNATAGALAKKLENIQLKRVAEKLIGSSKFGQTSTLVLELEQQYNTSEFQTRCRLAENRKEGSNYLLIKCTKAEYFQIREALKSNTAIEDPLKFWSVTAQPREEVSGVHNSEDGAAQGGNEERVSVQLRNFNKKLQEMAKLLQINEMRENEVKIAVLLDLCNRLILDLQHQYTKVNSLRNEASHCNEEIKENYKESMLGLRSLHNDVTSLVQSLEASVVDMTEVEKQQLARLQQYLRSSSKQGDLMEKEHKITSVPKASYSSPPDVGRKATKVELLPRANTLPGGGTPSDSSADIDETTLQTDTEVRPITSGSFLQRVKNKFSDKKSNNADKCQLTSYRQGSSEDVQLKKR